MRTRTVVAVGLAVALLVAGFVSGFASSDPDGLERVAESTGFIESAEDSPTAGSPLADYQVEGVEDERVGGGLAGVAGALTVLLLMGGLTLVLRRRAPDRDPERDPALDEA